MPTGSVPRLTRRINGPTPTNLGRAAQPRVAGVPSHPRDLLAIARLLAPEAAKMPGMTRLTGRRWEIIRRTEAFEAWVIGWPPGGEIELHDHGESFGAVFTVTGSLMETSVISQPAGDSTPGTPLDSATTSLCVLPAGTSLVFGTGHIHGISNVTETTAVSVHVYSPRLTRMTPYQIIDGTLTAQDTVRCDLGEALP